MDRLRRAGQLIGLAFALLLGGCAHVAPYERGALARGDMTMSETSGPAAKHARAVREGASRPGAVAESGCGCN